LKSIIHCGDSDREGSRLAWGAWIEISLRGYFAAAAGRASHGARGLKCKGRRHHRVRGGSRLAWGAWIEIQEIFQIRQFSLVAPRMGRVD